MNRPQRSGKNISVALKLLLSVFAIVLVIIGVQTWLNINNARQRNETEEKQNLIALYNDYNDEVNVLERASAALANSFADRLDVQELLLAQNRPGILALLSPIFTTLKTNYDIVHLYVHDPNGFVFVRIHDPKQYGDSIIPYRQTNTVALETHQTVAGVELDPNRLGVRGVAPMFHQGEFVGLVEVGLDYDQAFIEDLKARHGADYKMWVTFDAAAPTGLWPKGDEPESPSSRFFYYASTDPAPLPISEEVYLRVLQSGEPEIQFVSANGQELAVLAAPLLGYENRIIGILEISTSRAEALAALQHSEVITLSAAGGLALLALVLMWGSTHFIVLHPLGHLTAVAHRQLAGDLKARVELLPNDEFGQLGHTLNTLTRKLDNTLKSQENIIAELEAKNAELERFTYTVSHDLKSPLITINGFLGLLEKDAAKGDTVRMKGDIQRIRGATEKMQQLLDDLLELSRIGRLVNPPEMIPLGELAREALALVAGQIAERGVQVGITPDLPVVHGDRPRLLEVLQNLIDNAVKFMGDQPEPRVEIGAKQTQGETVCYVRDNGMGIEPRYQDKVFGLFERLDKTTQGTGIGLALVKRIVEVHGGRIWVQSEGLGHGSTFYFTLPQNVSVRETSESGG